MGESENDPELTVHHRSTLRLLSGAHIYHYRVHKYEIIFDSG